jgi:hypothetical protein
MRRPSDRSRTGTAVAPGSAVRLIATLVVVALFAFPATAAAVWTEPVTLTASGQDAADGWVGVDQGGNAVFVWLRRDSTTNCNGSGCVRVRTRARSAAGVLSTTQTLSPDGVNAGGPRIAVDPDGTAVFVWRAPDGTTDCAGYQCWRVQTRTRSATGDLTPIETLSDPGRQANSPQVAVDQDGDAVFAWVRRDDTTDCDGAACLRFQTRVRHPDGTLSAVQTLSAAGQNAIDPSLDVDQDGDAVFTWNGFDSTTDCVFGQPCFRVYARARSVAGALSTIQTLSAPGQEAYYPEVSVADPTGDAVFAWSRYDDSADCGPPFGGCLRVQTRVRFAAGDLTATQTLSAAGRHATYPQVGTDQDGDAVYVWQRDDMTTDCGSPCLRIQARARSVNGGTLSTIRTLSAAGAHANYADVAVDPNGDAVFVWSRQDGTTDCDGGPCARIQAAVASPFLATLTPTDTLSTAGQDTYLPYVAVDPAGDAVAVWVGDDGTYDRIQAAAGP